MKTAFLNGSNRWVYWPSGVHIGMYPVSNSLRFILGREELTCLVKSQLETMKLLNSVVHNFYLNSISTCICILGRRPTVCSGRNLSKKSVRRLQSALMTALLLFICKAQVACECLYNHAGYTAKGKRTHLSAHRALWHVLTTIQVCSSV